MTTGGESFVDTNVLCAATASARPFHARALARLEVGFATRSLCMSGQVVREYYAVATRPPEVNGLGLKPGEALANLRQFLDRAPLLAEDPAVCDGLIDLLARVPCKGKQVHDANIVATMIAHGVRRLITLNPQDFERFAPQIEIEAI